jgi:hypothetical protein
VSPSQLKANLRFLQHWQPSKQVSRTKTTLSLLQEHAL